VTTLLAQLVYRPSARPPARLLLVSLTAARAAQAPDEPAFSPRFELAPCLKLQEVEWLAAAARPVPFDPESRALAILVSRGIFRPADSSRTEYALEYRSGSWFRQATDRLRLVRGKHEGAHGDDVDGQSERNCPGLEGRVLASVQSPRERRAGIRPPEPAYDQGEVDHPEALTIDGIAAFGGGALSMDPSILPLIAAAGPC